MPGAWGTLKSTYSVVTLLMKRRVTVCAKVPFGLGSGLQLRPVVPKLAPKSLTS